MLAQSIGDLTRYNFSKSLGLKRGIVKDLKDPDNLNRIKVMLVDENVETPFADVMAQFAGPEYGSIFIPNVGDEVLLGFIDGDFNLPVVLGGVYNSKNKPHMPIDQQKNEIMKIQFKAGLIIEIDNKQDNQKITITTKKGHVITLNDGSNEFLEIKEKSGKTSFKIDFKAGTIDLLADNKISLTAGQDTLVLEKSKGLSLNSSAGKLDVNVNEIKQTAKSNIECSANAKVTVKGNAGAEFSAAGQTVIKGGIVQIN